MASGGTIARRAAFCLAALALAGCRAKVQPSDGGGSGGIGFSVDGGDGPAIRLDAAPDGVAVQLSGCGQYGLGSASNAVISRDGTVLAIAALDFIAIVDVATKTLLHKLPAPGNLYGLELSPDGAYVAATGFNDFYRVWRIADEALIVSGAPHGEPHFSPDGRQLLIANQNFSAYAFPSMAAQWSQPASGRAAYAPDGSFIATSEGVLLDPATGAKLGSVGTHPGVTAGWPVAVSSSGLIALQAGTRGALELWRASTRTWVATIPWSTDAGVLAFSADGTLLATVNTSSRNAHVWSVPDGALVAQIQLGFDTRDTISFTPSGGLLVPTDSAIRVIDVRAGVPTGKDTFTYWWGNTAFVFVAEVSPDGKLIATLSGVEKDVFVWNLATSELVTTLTQPDYATAIAFSPDGTILYITYGTTIAEWRVSDWTAGRRTGGHTRAITGVAVSRDGSLIASGARYEAMKVWRTADMANLVTIPVTETGGSPLAFSADGTLLGSLTDGMQPGIYRVADGALLGKWTGGTGYWSATRIAFTPDGSRLIVVGANGLALVSVPDGNLVRELPTGFSLYTFALAPAGNQLLTAALQGVQVWDLATGDLTGTGLFDGTGLASVVLTFVPGDAKRLVTAANRAARLYCRPAQDTWIID